MSLIDEIEHDSLFELLGIDSLPRLFPFQYLLHYSQRAGSIIINHLKHFALTDFLVFIISHEIEALYEFLSVLDGCHDFVYCWLAGFQGLELIVEYLSHVLLSYLLDE